MQRNQELNVFEAKAGIVFMDGAADYLKPEWKTDFQLAMDAQPTLVTTSSAGIPSYLTTYVDADLLRILTSPNKAAKILGEVKKGTWTDTSIAFQVIEQTAEVSAYGDYNANGRSGLNVNFPNRQPYHFQTFIEYGDQEAERAGAEKIGWAAELKSAAANGIEKYRNLTYFYGVAGLQNYGLLNDPSLPAALTPATKAATGTSCITTANVINATANEVFADVQALVTKLVTQAGGLIEADSPMVLALSPKSSMALATTNSFGITARGMIEQSYPNLRIETAIQYGLQTAQNPQGNAGGELVQLIATSVEGQVTGYCSFTEKLRAFPLVRSDSSYRQKFMAGSTGAVIRQPFAISSMLGV